MFCLRENLKIWSVRIPVYSLESNLINLITLVIYVKFLNLDLAINPFRTAKAVTNGNHTLCLKWKPQVKCH